MLTGDEVFPRLYGLIQQMHILSKQNAKHSGTFLGRGRIICILAQRANPISQRELADIATIKPGSLTQVLERLERDDLIRRERLVNDRRVIHVQLTDKGEKAYQQMNKERRQFGQHLLEGISQDDLASFIHVLSAMEDNLHHYYGDPLTKKKEGENK